MKLNANFQSKQPAVEEAPCEVSKVICLTDKEYAFFRKHLMYDYDFLRKNADGMGFRNGIRQCVLVMGETSEDGVLVDSSGLRLCPVHRAFSGSQKLHDFAGPESAGARGTGKPDSGTGLGGKRQPLYVYGLIYCICFLSAEIFVAYCE